MVLVQASPEPAAPAASQKPATLTAESKIAKSEPQQRIVHRVKRGDTLSSIARLYNTTIAALKSWNARTIRGNRINVGDRLTIFAARSAN
jgi:membrane-bound lytic murein transglycosylase D